MTDTLDRLAMVRESEYRRLKRIEDVARRSLEARERMSDRTLASDDLADALAAILDIASGAK